MGGLGLFNPVLKSKALLLKSMLKEYRNYYGDVDFAGNNRVYGYWEDFKKVYSEGIDMKSCKTIYDHLLEGITQRNGILIPSRNELRSVGINWKNVFNNFKVIRGITWQEKCFYWKMTQDMLNIGARMHHRNADKRCKNILADGEECQALQTIEHVFQECPIVIHANSMVIRVLTEILGKDVQMHQLLYYDFRHNNLYRLRCALWFAVKVLFKIYQDKCFNKSQLLQEMIKEIDWNISMGRKVGNIEEMIKVKGIMSRFNSG